MPIFKAFLGGVDPTKTTAANWMNFSESQGGNPETPEGLAALSRLADIHVKDNKSKVGQKLLAVGIVE